MSMHEFEDLVEQSVRALDASPRASEMDLRSMYAALYEFQGRWDTGFTHFRVMGLLLKHRFVYVFDIEEHPDFGRLGRSVFENESIYADPTKPWNAKTNPVSGYTCDPVIRWGARHAAGYPPELRRLRLYCDAGSPLWSRFVESRKLTGIDAIPPVKVPTQEVAAVVVREAELHSNRELVRQWFSLLFVDRMMGELDAFQKDPLFAQIRDTARRLHVRDIEMDYGCLRIPSEEDMNDMGEAAELARWWFAP